MISAITVNYKTKPDLERMLQSFFVHHHEACEMIVVDNGSGEDLSDLSARFPKAQFIFSKKNLGFAGGCNLGLKQAKGDYLLLVNPDLIFDSDVALQIEQRMRENPNVGIGGANIKNLDGSQQACVWRFPQPLDQLLLLLKIPHLLRHVGPVDRWLMRDFDYEQSADVDQVMGAFFCIRRKVLEDIGPLDDGFFMWYEEVDYCKRAQAAGWAVRYFHDVIVRHKRGSSFESISTFRKQAMVRRSLRRYMRKHYGTAAWLLFTLPEPLYIIVAAISALLKPR